MRDPRYLVFLRKHKERLGKDILSPGDYKIIESRLSSGRSKRYRKSKKNPKKNPRNPINKFS